ncbi:hypothetical protein ACT8ZR_09110 [Neobacillus sp. M.A.Huq-85]
MSAQCPNCNAAGYVVNKRKSEVKMECLDCHHRWITESKICPWCQRQNGYAVEGICAQCYSEKLALNHR